MDIQLVYVLVTSIMYSIIIGIINILLFSRTIGLWGMFSKIGISEWKSLVPFYGQITLLKKLKLSPLCILLYIDFLIPIIGFFAGRDIKWAFIIVMIGFLIYRYIIAIRLGDAFKKGTVFCFFLAFFPSILYPVIGCSKNSQYTEIELKESKK